MTAATTPENILDILSPEHKAAFARASLLANIAATKADLSDRLLDYEKWHEDIRQLSRNGTDLTAAVDRFLDGVATNDTLRNPSEPRAPTRQTAISGSADDIRRRSVHHHVLYCKFRAARKISWLLEQSWLGMISALLMTISLVCFVAWMAWGVSSWAVICALAVTLTMALIFLQSGVIRTIEDEADMILHREFSGLLNQSVTDLLTNNSDIVLGNLDKARRKRLRNTQTDKATAPQLRHTRGPFPDCKNPNFRPTPEFYIRTLDEQFHIKEAINSFESTIRGRLNHVSTAVVDLEKQKRKSYDKAKRGALGMTASFFVFEIGERIQAQRDLNIGLGNKAFRAWVEQPGALVQIKTQEGQHWQTAVHNCAATLSAQSPKTDACMQAWIDADRVSSLEVVIATVLISMLIMLMHFLQPDTMESSANPIKK